MISEKDNRELKEVDISACPVIGRGGAGTVYRLDEDTGIGHSFFKQYYDLKNEEELQGLIGRFLPLCAFNTVLNAAISGETNNPVFMHVKEMIQEGIAPNEQAIIQGLNEL